MPIGLTAVLISVWAAWCLMGQLWGNYFPRCIVYAFGVGIIMNDIPSALLMGATAELAYMGFGQGAGGVAPPNNIGPGLFGTVWLINSGGELTVPELMTMTLPVAIIFQFLTTLIFTVMAPNNAIIQRSINKQNWKTYKWANNCTIIAFGIMGILAGILAVFSSDAVINFATLLQEKAGWLMKGFQIAGGLLPAIGFAMILSVMLKKQYIPFAILGYSMTAWIFTDQTYKSWIIGVTLIATAIGLIVLFASKLTDRDAMVKAKGSSENVEKAISEVDAIRQSESNENEEEDYSNGI